MCRFPPFGFYSSTSTCTNPKYLGSLQTVMATLVSERCVSLQQSLLAIHRSSKPVLQPWRRTIRAPGLSRHYTFPMTCLLQQTSFRLVWELLHLQWWATMFRSISCLFLSGLYWRYTFKCTSGGCTYLPAGFNKSSPFALENLPMQLSMFSWKISVLIKH